MSTRVLISAGEASGDRYAAQLVEKILEQAPDTEFFGCAGPLMRAAGVEPVIDASQLSVVGLLEVLTHIPRIWREYRKLLRIARQRRPDVAVLTDSPDFHLRVARKLHRMGIPVVYLVAPQVWAWRKGRIRQMRSSINDLLCIFPFEKAFFEKAGMAATFIGNPLAYSIRAGSDPLATRERLNVEPGMELVALLPGSRAGEIARHLPILLSAVEMLRIGRRVRFVLALPDGLADSVILRKIKERISSLSIEIVEGQAREVLACADLALAASGTVTVEAALLGTPMVSFYRVNAVSWLLGKLLVRVPYFTMVNLIAERRVVPELIQSQMTGERVAFEAAHLLDNEAARAEMKLGLSEVARKLLPAADPMAAAAAVVRKYHKKEIVHVS